MRAKYENGVFKPLEEVKVKEGTVLEFYLPPTKVTHQSIRSFAFTGMWKNRKDIRDGVNYVNKLRENPRT